MSVTTSNSRPVTPTRRPLSEDAAGAVADRGAADLLEIVQKYNEVTEHLKASHERLGHEVCRLREALHEKNRELQRREQLAALGEMAAGVAHEIRNPLGGIGIYASLLAKDLHDRPKQCDLAQRIGRGVQTLESIINDILTFAGDAEPAVASASLAAIIENVVAQAEARAGARGVQLHVDPAASNVMLQCDAPQITRAIANLVFNAIDAVEERGNVWIRVARSASRGGDRTGKLFEIHVEDDGPGIEPELLHRVFTPFFTTKHTGTGLGLAIVHRIAEANGGFVFARNRESGGAVFGLRVPAAA